MAFLVGVVLALAVGVMATTVGLDRDRAFYPTVTIVIASYYVLFAVMGASTQILVLEVLLGLVFLAAALWGFKSSLWIAAAALALHGVQDLWHDRIIVNAGVPAWWPYFCCGYDLAAPAYLAWLIKTGRVRASPTAGRP